MYDLHNKVRALPVILPVAIGANGTDSGVAIDLQGYSGVEFFITYGAIANADTAIVAEVVDGDVSNSLTAVADEFLLGTETAAGLAAAARVSGTTKEVVKRIGYVGNKRYVSVNLTSTGTSDAGIISVIAVLHSAHLEPTANP